MTQVNYELQSANQPWSVTQPDSSTLRFELRPADHWSFDYSTSVQRTEIAMSNSFQAGTPLEITYNFNIEPGPVTTAFFTTLGQMHAESDGVPPYYIQLAPGDHMEVTSEREHLKIIIFGMLMLTQPSYTGIPHIQ